MLLPTSLCASSLPPLSRQRRSWRTLIRLTCHGPGPLQVCECFNLHVSREWVSDLSRTPNFVLLVVTELAFYSYWDSIPFLVIMVSCFFSSIHSESSPGVQERVFFPFTLEQYRCCSTGGGPASSSIMVTLPIPPPHACV